MSPAGHLHCWWNHLRMIAVRRHLLVGLLCAAVSWPAQPAAAQDPDASNPPRVSGPLVGSPLGCEDNGPAAPGEAKGQSCSWLYDLVPAESNLEENFSAYWVQMEIDPGKGWCAKEMSFTMSAPSDGRIVSAAPDRGGRIGKSRLTTTELIVDAEGAAPLPGTVAQDVKPGRGRVTVTMDESVYSYRWRGNSRDKVVLAVGIQMTHAGLPPELFSTWSEGMSFTMGSCRTPSLRFGPR